MAYSQSEFGQHTHTHTHTHNTDCGQGRACGLSPHCSLFLFCRCGRVSAHELTQLQFKMIRLRLWIYSSVCVCVCVNLQQRLLEFIQPLQNCLLHYLNSDSNLPQNTAAACDLIRWFVEQNSFYQRVTGIRYLFPGSKHTNGNVDLYDKRVC